MYPNETNLDAIVNESALVMISFYPVKEVVSLDKPFYGDYIEANKRNCYSTKRLDQGGDLVVLTYVTNFTLYLRPGYLPDSHESYVYSSQDFIVQAEDIGYSAINIPILKENVKSHTRVYFCLESNTEFAYSLLLAEHESIVVQPGQSMKVYLHGSDRLLMTYLEIMHIKPLLNLTFSKTKGCFNLLIKTHQSPYYGELIAKNLSAGISQFGLLTEDDLVTGDTIMSRLFSTRKSEYRVIKAKTKDTLCTGTDTYTQCNTYFIFETCERSSVAKAETRFTLEHNNDPLIFTGGEILLLVLAGYTKKYIILDIPPNIEILRVIIEQRELLVPTLIGRLMLIQKNTGKLLMEEITGKERMSVIEFKKKGGESLEGDYYVQIEGIQNVNVRLRMNMYSYINNELVEVYNARLPLSDGSFPLNLFNGNRKVGYFSFYAKNDPGTEVAIIIQSNHNNIKIFHSTSSWTNKNKLITNILRLPRDNSYHYLTIETEYENTRVSFDFLESQRFNELKKDLHYSFQGTRIFHIKVDKRKDYIIRKSGNTIETIYLSIDSNIKIPLEDKNTRVILPEGNEQEIRIKEEELTNTSEMHFTIRCHSSECYYHLKVEEIVKKEIRSDL